MRFFCLPLLLMSLTVCGCAGRADSAGPQSPTADDIATLRSQQQQLDDQMHSRLQVMQVSMDNSLGQVFAELELARTNAAAAWEKASTALELTGERQAEDSDAAATELKAAVQAILSRLDRIEKQLQLTENRSGTQKQAVQSPPPQPAAPPAPPTVKTAPALRKTTPETSQAHAILPPDLATALKFATQTAAGTVAGYDSGDYGLGAYGKKSLDQLITAGATQRPDLITIIGFGDPQESMPREKNDDLAWKRADAVKRYLVDQGTTENTVLTVNGGPGRARVEVIAWRWERP